jgi:sortase A
VSRAGEVVRTLLRGFGQTLITVGVVLLLFCVYELQFTNLVTARAQEQLAAELQRSWSQSVPAPRTAPVSDGLASSPPPASEPPPASPPPPPPGSSAPLSASSAAPVPPPVTAEPGSALAVLHIPRLGRWNDEPAVVVEGVSTADLKRGPGHIPGTALPGEIGNLVLSGHRTTYGAPFARVDELRPGDAVVVETRDSWFTYSVTGTRIVAPTAVEVTWPVPGQRSATPTEALLTLTTCHPRYSARQRLVVQAELTATDAKGDGPPTALRAASAGGS